MGSPGAGKTVAASSLFAALKRNHIDSVLISEAAKDFVVEENQSALANQIFVWATQQYRIFCGYRHAQVVVTDSPILLGAIYNADGTASLVDVIVEQYHRYNNFNILVELNGDHPYSMVGRIHSVTQSIGIQDQIVQLLQEREIPYLNYGEYSEDEIVQLIMEALK